MRKFVVALVVVAIFGACSGDPGALPKVPDLKTRPATTTTDIDYSQVPLKGVSGHGPTTSVVLGPGHATVSGNVTGDDGAVPGATVQVERVVNGATATAMVQTAQDGSWTVPQILGGHYRVRAWRAPDLAQTAWSAVFLGSTESKNVQLRVRTVGGLSVDASIAPDPPRLGQDANLVALVTQKVVDDQGVVRATPQVNVEVDLITSSGWRILSANPDTTNGNGEVAWTLRCRTTGHQPLAVTVGSETIPLTVSSCEDTTPETTTTTSEVSLVP